MTNLQGSYEVNILDPQRNIDDDDDGTDEDLLYDEYQKSCRLVPIIRYPVVYDCTNVSRSNRHRRIQQEKKHKKLQKHKQEQQKQQQQQQQQEKMQQNQLDIETGLHHEMVEQQQQQHSVVVIQPTNDKAKQRGKLDALLSKQISIVSNKSKNNKDNNPAYVDSNSFNTIDTTTVTTSDETIVVSNVVTIKHSSNSKTKEKIESINTFDTTIPTTTIIASPTDTTCKSTVANTTTTSGIGPFQEKHNNSSVNKNETSVNTKSDDSSSNSSESVMEFISKMAATTTTTTTTTVLESSNDRQQQEQNDTIFLQSERLLRYVTPLLVFVILMLVSSVGYVGYRYAQVHKNDNIVITNTPPINATQLQKNITKGDNSTVKNVFTVKKNNTVDIVQLLRKKQQQYISDVVDIIIGSDMNTNDSTTAKSSSSLAQSKARQWIEQYDQYEYDWSSVHHLLMNDDNTIMMFKSGADNVNDNDDDDIYDDDDYDNDNNSIQKVTKLQLDQHIIQRYVLAVLYYSIGLQYINSSQWDSTMNMTGIRKNSTTSKLGWLSNSNECSKQYDDNNTYWYGLDCDSNNHIKTIWFDSIPLSGTIPSEIQYLTSLQFLKIQGNSNNSTTTNLIGTIPTELGTLSLLKHIAITNHPQLSGSLSMEELFASSLQTLEYINLNGNNLSGTIPLSIANMTSLRTIIVSNNRLNGIIPFDVLGTISTLTYLDASSNNFMGNISSSSNGIETCEQLQYILLHDNNLTGQIPSTIGKTMSNLRYIDFDSNSLTGTIPQTIGNISNLQYLSIESNSLIGSIPSTLTQLTNLHTLALSYNKLIGTVPTINGRMKHTIRNIQLSSNQLDGNVSNALHGLTSLEILQLSSNKFTGSIPNVTTSRDTMKTLNLSNNQFSGTIPTKDICSLKNIQWLSFDNNTNLIGNRIPECIDRYNET